MNRMNGNMHWTHAEDIMMAEAYECGMSDKELSELLGRSDKSISVRRTKLANRKLKSYSRKAYKIITAVRNERRNAYIRGEIPAIKSTANMPTLKRPMSAAKSGRLLAKKEAERAEAKDRPIEVYSKLPMTPERPRYDWPTYALGFASGSALVLAALMAFVITGGM